MGDATRDVLAVLGPRVQIVPEPLGQLARQAEPVAQAGETVPPQQALAQPGGNPIVLRLIGQNGDRSLYNVVPTALAKVIARFVRFPTDRLLGQVLCLDLRRLIPRRLDAPEDRILGAVLTEIFAGRTLGRERRKQSIEIENCGVGHCVSNEED